MTRLKKNHDKYISFGIISDAINNALQFSQPENLINQALRFDGHNVIIKSLNSKRFKLNINKYNSIYVIGAGKATAKMTLAISELLGKRISGGSINVPKGTKIAIQGIHVNQSRHPIPDSCGQNGARRIIKLLEKTEKNDLIFTLISGGGSALLPLPAKGLPLNEKKKITARLITSGADINEVNTVRKHLSQVKGGNLVKYRHTKSTMISLIISDVVGDSLDIIASGPTVPDLSTYYDAKKVLLKYHLWDDKLFPNVLSVINDGLKGKIDETPKPGNPIFSNVSNFLIGNNVMVCSKLARQLTENKISATYVRKPIHGSADEFGRMLAKVTLKMKSVPSVIVMGGETTVKLSSKAGKGGRNQESILYALENHDLRKLKDFAVCSFGTDGIDGNSLAAGALITPATIRLLDKKKSSLEISHYLESHNSNDILNKLNSIILTGITGTNVNDIALVCRVR